MSLFADYKLERENKTVLETEEFFASYEHSGDTVYIEDIYVVPSKRKSGLATRVANQIVAFAKQAGCKKLMGSVSVNAQGAHESLLVLIAYGMKLSSVRNDVIFFEKEI